MSKEAPYGTWDSLITGELIVSKNIVFDDVLVDPVTKAIYHLEERTEPDTGKSRCVIVETKTNNDVIPSPYSARTFVQEYGGAPAIVYNNVVYFSNDTGNSDQPDNSIYAINVTDASKVVKRITPVDPLMRYANFAIHPKCTNLLITLREDHTKDQDKKHPHPENVVNTICVVDTTAPTGNVVPVIDGADFYATPVLSPSGDKIAWQEWNLPDMPWAGGLVYVANVSVDSGSLKLTSKPEAVAGEAGKVSATFPSWITDTMLAYITDGHNKYWNPYIYDTDKKASRAVLKKPVSQDFAEPAWNLGLYPYAILGGGKYGAFTAFKDGGNTLYIVDLAAPSDPVQIDKFDYTVAQHVRAATEDTFVFTGSRKSAAGGVVLGTVSGSQGSYAVELDVLKYSATIDPKLAKYISPPIPKTLSLVGGHPIYVVYYAPCNPDYSGPTDEKPPCIVGVHGGPTGLEPQSLNWIKMYYTSRGFAWMDVNYRGSSGYGREYRDLLNGKWGIYDVEDCKEAASIMAHDSFIDGNRVAIRGGSAGAYTTLASITFGAPLDKPTFYKSACGAYGCVADVELLTKVTEKFEMQYIFTLFGCKPDGGAWDPRNPIKHVANIRSPLLMLQGLADGVVPPEIVRNFLAQSSQVAPSGSFVFYPNEGHHWHQASTIKNALAREYRWYLDTLL